MRSLVTAELGSGRVRGKRFKGGKKAGGRGKNSLKKPARRGPVLHGHLNKEEGAFNRS